MFDYVHAKLGKEKLTDWPINNEVYENVFNQNSGSPNYEHKV